MKRLSMLAVSFILSGTIGLTALACTVPLSGGLQPTPPPPATPLPANTPVPPPTISPLPIQRMQKGLTQHNYVTVHNLEGSADAFGKLVANSPLIVIGTVPNAEPDTVQVQDKSAANIQIVGSSVNVQVERYLKGSGGDTIPVVQFYGLNYTEQGKTKETRNNNKDLLLGKNNRYLLFLRENGSYKGHWIGTAHPYKFLLEDGKAKAESPVGNLNGAFPNRSEAEFVSEVEALIAGSN